MAKTKVVPPDGGYGWVVAGAYALHHFIAVPTMQIYGLLFKDAFKDLGFTSTDTTFVMNTQAAFAMFMGLANGPLLKHFGYRKMSIVGAFFFTTGIIATSFANSFVQYVITFSLTTAVGIGIGMASYPFAFNSYFLSKRSKAASYALTMSGLGVVLMPQVISFLLSTYGVKGAVMITGGLTSHVFIAALLLQPVERHMKEVIIDDSKEEGTTRLPIVNEDIDDGLNSLIGNEIRASKTTLRAELDIESKYSVATPFGSVLSLHSILPYARSTSSVNLNRPRKSSREESKKASQSVQKEERTFLRRVAANLVDTFDLSLLNDPIYLNIMFGLSLALFAEISFAILTPFIMNDYGLSVPQIATFLSTMAIADICFRLLAPYLSDFLKQPARIMYLWTLIFIILARFSLLLVDKFHFLLVCALFIGLSKGFRTVYWSLVIPNYVPIEKLASALGLQSTLNGTLVWMGAPFFGFIRDITGSYKNCIFVINAITFITPIMWCVEFIYLRCKPKREDATELRSVD